MQTHARTSPSNSARIRTAAILLITLATLSAVFLLTPSASADHPADPWIDTVGDRLFLFPTGPVGPDELGVDQPFHVIHGFDLAERPGKTHKDHYFTLQYDTSPEDALITDGILAPTAVLGCSEAEPGDCKGFLYNFEDGMRDVVGPDFEGGTIRFIATWYEPCGASTIWPEGCPDGIDEDQVVAVVHNEFEVVFVDD